MATKQQVAEYIDANWSTAWSKEEETLIDQMLDPTTAEILIKLVGDVEFLTEVARNKSN